MAYISPVSKARRKQRDTYRPLADAFKVAHPACACCIAARSWMLDKDLTEPFFAEILPLTSMWTSRTLELKPDKRIRKSTDVHHLRGRSGALLCDQRYWVAVCRRCHNWIGDHPAAARELGMLCAEGKWGSRDPEPDFGISLSEEVGSISDTTP